MSRRWTEAGKNPRRSAFERDRARVLHSSALRRLGAKTQVLGPASDDFVRTRLTHSLEVAQVGRALASALGCDPDVVDAACLSHDLGHPPFGHNGERALDEVSRGVGGFEGNAQTLRLLTRLEPKAFADDGTCMGLNLTRASLDAATKYPWPAGQGPRRADGTTTRKFGAYDDDLEVFAWMREGAPPHRRCLEAQVMDLADDIAYSVHDVEDAVVGGRIPLSALRSDAEVARVVGQVRAWYDPPLPDDELGAALGRLQALPSWVADHDGSRRSLARLKDMTSQLIGRFCAQAEDATRAAAGAGHLTRYAADLV
ncbi:deoxyguanosinetriphosphate triphosphohydrolase, partial [Georgenia sp. 10Sc9-8]|nr:deoxyguanosinetriphosphate triphosphohydrolase [Georgenia halotolerans]